MRILILVGLLTIGLLDAPAFGKQQLVVRDGQEYMIVDGREIPFTRDPMDLNRDGRTTRAERKEMRRRAEQGDADAQYNIGNFDSDYNRKEMHKWLLLAAEQGHAYAASGLGSLLEPKRLYGGDYGVPTDLEKSVMWYRKAIAGGAEEAKTYLARTQYNNGDYDAAQGDADEQYELGRWYWNAGQFAGAEKWMRQSAQKGLLAAQLMLADMYIQGQGVQANDSEAAKWTQLAAEQGHMQSQTNLGWFYETGRGVQRDEAVALTWYRKAAAQGDAKAGQYLASLEGMIVSRARLASRQSSEKPNTVVNGSLTAQQKLRPGGEQLAAASKPETGGSRSAGNSKSPSSEDVDKTKATRQAQCAYVLTHAMELASRPEMKGKTDDGIKMMTLARQDLLTESLSTLSPEEAKNTMNTTKEVMNKGDPYHDVPSLGDCTMVWRTETESGQVITRMQLRESKEGK